VKLIQTRRDTPRQERQSPAGLQHTWKLLAVDDDPDVREVTRLNLRNFLFNGRTLEILEASSAAQAREMLNTEPNIAVALIDVVMKTDDAGLQLVKFIRE
jgi:CheY-like chemotaxis protein